MDQSRTIFMDHRLSGSEIPSGLWLALGCIAPAPLLAALLPTSVVLPALSAVLFVGAAIAGLFAWLGKAAGPVANRPTLWDLAAAFAFVACVAGSLSETASVAQLFGVAMAIP
jgi:uncharacterized protein involved in response to NO